MNRAIRVGFLGLGQGGSKIAESGAELGYPTACINTSLEDLERLQHIPPRFRLFCEVSRGGAGKNVAIGLRCVEKYEKAISELLDEALPDADLFFITVGLGGGTGTGAVIPLLEMLKGADRKVLVLATLPYAGESLRTKANALDAIQKLYDVGPDGLIILDNEKLMRVFGEMYNTMDLFWAATNRGVISLFDRINRVVTTKSWNVNLDAQELFNILTAGKCLTLAECEVVMEGMTRETIVAEIINSWENGMFASGFDYRTAQLVGLAYVSPTHHGIRPTLFAEVETEIRRKTEAIDIAKGDYREDRRGITMTVYSVLGGLSLPKARIGQLREECLGVGGLLQEKILREERDVRDGITTELELVTHFNEVLEQRKKMRALREADRLSAAGKAEPVDYLEIIRSMRSSERRGLR